MANSEEFNKIREIFSIVPEIHLHSKKGSRFLFPVYMTDKLSHTEIEALELGVRSHHCLKRAGIDTIGQLCDWIVQEKPLASIRGCGKTSVSEIMDHLFAYHYYQLKPDKRERYLASVIERNVLM